MYVADYNHNGTVAAKSPMYDRADGSDITLEHMRYILGDGDKATNRTPNGYIDSTDVPRSTAPYLLWAAGPDTIFGFDSVNSKTDDVTNFDIPPQYLK